MKCGKAPGPDICAEHLRHLGPIAKTTLLRLLNVYWSTGQGPAGMAPCGDRPDPQGGEGPEADKEPQADCPHQPSREVGRASGRRPPLLPGGGPQARAAGAGGLQEGAIGRREPDQAGAACLGRLEQAEVKWSAGGGQDYGEIRAPHLRLLAGV